MRVITITRLGEGGGGGVVDAQLVILKSVVNYEVQVRALNLFRFCLICIICLRAIAQANVFFIISVDFH